MSIEDFKLMSSDTFYSELEHYDLPDGDVNLVNVLGFELDELSLNRMNEFEKHKSKNQFAHLRISSDIAAF